MSELKTLYNEIIHYMNVEGLSIPCTAVKFYRNEDIIPQEINQYKPSGITLTSCQASKQASLGDAVLLTKENIGCIAAAISFGLVDQHDNNPFEGPRVYTDIMKDQMQEKTSFKPPTPRDFTEGIVYACRDSGRQDFCLFGAEDSGRFKNTETAKKAIQQMTAIQPAVMKAVFFFSTDFDEIEIAPDVVVLSVRPVELTRIVQAYQYNTGERVTGNMGPVRVVNSDLIVRPFITGKMNFSSYCIGARLIAQFGPDRLGLGMPWDIFKETVLGMKDSETGYPFELYPGADSEAF